MDPALLALLGAVFGGAGLEIIKKWLNRSKEKTDEASAFRKELRDEVASLRSELGKVEHELDEWKDKYYKLYQDYIGIKQQLEDALRKLR